MRWLLFLLVIAAALPSPAASHAGYAHAGSDLFRQQVQPVLREFCFDCHADGARKGGVAFDEFNSDQALLEDRSLWFKALKNVRTGLMPPATKPQPSAAQRAQIDAWIKSAVFKVDPENLDPGRVTVRRLNRVEYQNTIRDLIGVDFSAETEFPADDTGHGFDNIGDSLTLSPMLLEKYLDAGKAVIAKGVPSVPRVPAVDKIEGSRFRSSLPNSPATTNRGSLSVSFYTASTNSEQFLANYTGRYQLLLDLTVNERHVENQFDYNKCLLIFREDGTVLLSQEFGREGSKAFHYEFDQEWKSGNHTLSLEVQPLTPDQKQVRSLTLRIESVTVRGPLEEAHWFRAPNHERFFSKDAPAEPAARREYCRNVLAPFVRRAYRRPVDSATLDRLVTLAEHTYTQPGKAVEAGVAQAMTAVLASPRFLFREEGAEPAPATGKHPLVDEFSLASRLSYFLWSSLPDAQLLDLAEKHQLRDQLPSQLQRMLADSRSEALTRNFVGQWLQTRDMETVSIDARQVLAREALPDPEFEQQRVRFRTLRDKSDDKLTPEESAEMAEFRKMFAQRQGLPVRAELSGELRRSMRLETEKLFEFVLKENRSLLELLDSDYTFLNERLAKHYGLTNLAVLGEKMRRVALPPGSPRRGILTHGSVLTVTSNPTRTSPVKRGLFVLDNILGSPPPPPPPDIPSLENATQGIKGRTPSLRETLALHREQPLCSSCHDRMDPLGLALDNFNALGMWRDQERNEPIDATGKLITGETFTNVIDLTRILASGHATEFYRTVTEKLLTYALGRGLDYYDVPSVDLIVDRLVRSQGRPSELLTGIIDSAPFQRTRTLAKERKDSKLQP